MKRLVVFATSVILMVACLAGSITTKAVSSATTKQWPFETGIRGFNTSPGYPAAGDKMFYTDTLFSNVKGWGANCIRVMLARDMDSKWAVDKSVCPPTPKDDPLAPYRGVLEELDESVRLATKYGIYVVVCVDGIVEKINHSDNLLNSDGSGYHTILEAIWEYVADKYKNSHWVIGYDLFNETSTPSDVGAWWDYVPTLIEKIRKIDKQTYMLVQAPNMAIPTSFRNLKPVNSDDDRIIYVAHPYIPHGWTHSNVTTNPVNDAEYPGYIAPNKSEYVDKEKLKEYMIDVRNFQLKYNVRIFANEFSSVRWQKGGGKWTEDMIDIFEEWGWDWLYHAYGSWNGWNPTFDADDPVSNQLDGGKVTDRLEALIKGFALNTVKRAGFTPTPSQPSSRTESTSDTSNSTITSTKDKTKRNFTTSTITIEGTEIPGTPDQIITKKKPVTVSTRQLKPIVWWLIGGGAVLLIAIIGTVVFLLLRRKKKKQII